MITKGGDGSKPESRSTAKNRQTGKYKAKDTGNYPKPGEKNRPIREQDKPTRRGRERWQGKSHKGTNPKVL